MAAQGGARAPPPEGAGVVSKGHVEPRRPFQGGAEIAAAQQQDQGELAVVHASDMSTLSMEVEGDEMRAHVIAASAGQG